VVSQVNQYQKVLSITIHQHESAFLAESMSHESVPPRISAYYLGLLIASAQETLRSLIAECPNKIQAEGMVTEFLKGTRESGEAQDGSFTKSRYRA